MSKGSVGRRKLPKLMACMTKNSLEVLRNKTLFSMDILDARGIRRKRIALYQCLILELNESGYNESSDYLQDLIYDNLQLVKEDEIGIVIDLRKREDYLEYIVDGLMKAEKHRDKGNTKQECLELLALAQFFVEQGRGIVWLAEKFFLAAIAVSSQYLIDGGRQKGCCRYYYAKFLLDKFPGSDPEEPYNILTEVRNLSMGKDWPLVEPDPDSGDVIKDSETVFAATAIQLHRVLVTKAKSIRNQDPGKAERHLRLAERRARDADVTSKIAESIIEIGICQLVQNNLNNAQKTFEKAFKIHKESNNIEGLCETTMHLAAIWQRLGDHEKSAKLLTEMGILAMEHELRRQLGRALHLLGELHLRRERPELGTQHLSEAFSCFMGYSFEKNSKALFNITDEKNVEEVEIIHCQKPRNETYREEAEQSRLMMAISSGQELMASYFNLIREAHGCTVAQTKTIEWKLSKSGWWLHKAHHDLVPCMCKVHHRTPLDVLKKQLEIQAALEAAALAKRLSDERRAEAAKSTTSILEPTRHDRASHSSHHMLKIHSSHFSTKSMTFM